MPTGKKIRFGIIGLGKMGGYHLQKVTQHPDAEIIGLFDIDQNKSREIANANSCESFETSSELIDNCEAVILASPTSTHYKIGSEILANKRHLLIEKPITDKIEEAARLVELAEEHSVILAVGHIENFNPALRAAFDYIKKPIFVESHRLSPFVGRGIDVSVVMDLMIHDIEILQRIMGDIRDVHASGGKILTDNIDIASARVELGKGVANITASRISDRSLRKMRIFSKGGYVSIDFAQKKTEIILAPDFPNIPEDAQKFPIGDAIFYRISPKIKPNDQLYEQLCDFISAIQKDTEPFVSGRNGLHALELAHKIQKDILEKD